MSARASLTAMFAPFLSGKLLEGAAATAYTLVLNEAADHMAWALKDTPEYGPWVADQLRLMAASPAATPVPDETAGDETGEAYPGELAHLRDLLRGVGRLADKQPEGNPLTELLIDHYSDSRMVDAELAKSEPFPQSTRGRARIDAKTAADAEATHWRRLGITPEGGA